MTAPPPARGGMLALSFSSGFLEAEPDAGLFRASVGPGRIELVGYLTAVGRTWSLGATAVCRRRRIAVNVTATERADAQPASLRHYGYRAVLEGLPPGRYSLRVSHVYGVGGRGYLGLDVPTYGSALLVP